jgi:hypothetical protein
MKELSHPAIIRRALPRRTFLRGLGAAVALPLLDAMVPALAAQAGTPARSTSRLAVVYLPNGIVMSEWTPAKDGATFDLSPTLAPLARFRDRLIVITGLRNGAPHLAVHGAASTRFLTTVAPEPSTGSVVGAGMSMDQLAAAEFGRETPLGSLELTLESSYAGACDIGSSCVYTDTISWRGPATPLPMEHNPRAVFERLFGEQDTTDAGTRLARQADERSILDSVTQAAADLQRTLGGPDRAKMTEYLDAVRDVERRIQNLEKRVSQELPGIDRPTRIPAAFADHCRLMFDLQVLAHQADLTRVTTFMMGRELSGRSFPEIDIREAHHPTSHHQGDPEKIAKLIRINAHFTNQFAYFLDRLRSTADGDGSLLDHLTILYGAGMSDGDSHSPENLPLLVTNGGVGRLRGGRHLRFPTDTLIANLHRTLLEQLGIRVDHFGNSTGRLEI